VFTFDEMLAQVAAGRGTFEKVKNCPDDAQASRTETNPQPPPCDGAVTLCGFNLHASVRVAADDDRARERLSRYCLRPPCSLDRLCLFPDGCYGYSVKKPGPRESRFRCRSSRSKRSHTASAGGSEIQHAGIRRSLGCESDLAHDQPIRVGGLAGRVLHTPVQTAGACCF